MQGITSQGTAHENAAAADALPETPSVFADSRPAVTLARRRGLPSSATIRTSAPALLRDPSFETEAADELLTAENIHAIEDGLFSAAEEVHQRILRGYDGPLERDDIALIAARVVCGRLQDFLFPAACLRERDFAVPPIVVTPYHERSDQRYWFYAGILNFFDVTDGAEKIEIPAAELPLVEGPQPDEPSLWFRLRHLGVEAYIFKLGVALWDRVFRLSGRGCLLIARENELLRESATELIKRGYAVRKLPSGPSENRVETKDRISPTIMTEALAKHLPWFYAPSAVEKMQSLAVTQLRQDLGRYEHALSYWEERLADAGYRRARGALTNMLIDPAHVALQRVLKQREIPLVGFQHGVTSEIAARQARNIYIQENTWCDTALNFNAAMTDYCFEGGLGLAEAVTVGMPKVYHRLSCGEAARRDGDLWYISTAIYQGNIGRVHRGLSDAEICRREVALLDDVFGTLPHKVVFKPYPVYRYVDDDPVLEHADEIPNVDVYREGFDFRYLASAARVLVTCGATSTVSWCLMTKLPLVFIDDPDWMPLKPDARSAFEEATFLFDNTEPDIHGKLRDFLSQPYEEIERLWKEKSRARERMIEKFIASGDAAAGKRAADAVERRLKSNAHSRP